MRLDHQPHSSDSRILPSRSWLDVIKPHGKKIIAGLLTSGTALFGYLFLTGRLTESDPASSGGTSFDALDPTYGLKDQSSSLSQVGSRKLLGTLATPIPNQHAWRGEEFSLSINPSTVFSGLNGSTVQLNASETGQASLPDFLAFSPSFSASPLGIYNVSFAENVQVVGSTAYVAARYSGLQIIDVSNSSDPTLLGSYPTTPDSAQDVQVVGNTAYVAAGDSGLLILDVSTLSAPTLLGSRSISGYARGVRVVGSTAYVAAQTLCLQIINISTPSAPTLLGKYNSGGLAANLQVVGNTAYVADGDSGLEIIDVSNPSAPTLLGRYFPPRQYYAYGVHVVGTTAYVADWQSGLQILDVSTPSAPILLGSCETPGHHDISVQVVGTTAYMAAHSFGLQIIDVSNSSSPTLLGSYNTPYPAWDVQVVDSIAYVADGHHGLQILDITPRWVLAGTPTHNANYSITITANDGISTASDTFDLVITEKTSKNKSKVGLIVGLSVGATALLLGSAIGIYKCCRPRPAGAVDLEREGTLDAPSPPPTSSSGLLPASAEPSEATPVAPPDPDPNFRYSPLP